MRIRRHEGQEVRIVLTGMITDASVIAHIAPRWSADGLFGQRWADLIGSWCARYFERYEDAPKSHIFDIFQRWADRHETHKSIAVMDRFLGSLSDSYERGSNYNSDYVLDVASEYFEKAALEKLANGIVSEIETGNLKEAKQLYDNFTSLNLGVADDIDFFSDKQNIKDSLEHTREPLISYPGALGEFFGDELEREGLIAFQAAEKRGKSFWLVDLAWKSLIQGRRVAFFSVGDMSRRQLTRRLCVRFIKRPLVPCTYHYPEDIFRADGEPFATVDLTERECHTPIDMEIVWNRFKQINAKFEQPPLKVSVHPNDSISVDGIRSIVRRWHQKSWVPDVIVIDYADILATPTNKLEGRDAINKTWQGLRRLSQEAHCLVITATQSDAASYDVRLQSRRNFSEDKRKYSHVTGMCAINCDEENEKPYGIYRLNWLVLRDWGYSTSRCIHTASCLSIGRVAIKSTW